MTMTDTAIKVENLSKRYIIGKHAQKGDGLRHVIQNTLSSPLRWASCLRLRSSATGTLSLNIMTLRPTRSALRASPAAYMPGTEISARLAVGSWLTADSSE